MTTIPASKRLVKEIAQLCENFQMGIYETASPTDRTIFTGEFDDTTVEGLWLVEAPGPPPHSYIDTEYIIIDFWAMSPKTPRAHALLEMAQNNFHRRYNYETANWRIYFSQALGTIIDVDRSREGSKLFRLSVQFICRNLNNLS